MNGHIVHIGQGSGITGADNQAGKFIDSHADIRLCCIVFYNGDSFSAREVHGKGAAVFRNLLICDGDGKRSVPLIACAGQHRFHIDNAHHACPVLFQGNSACGPFRQNKGKICIAGNLKGSVSVIAAQSNQDVQKSL